VPYIEALVVLGLPIPRLVNNVNNVKFYPYLKPDDDTIFAVCGERHVQIYRPSQDVDHAFQLIKSYIDPDVS